MKLIPLALGLAGGYAAARALEAKAIGLPLNQAFKLDSILKPVSAVQKLLAAGTTVASSNIIDVTPIPASSQT